MYFCAIDAVTAIEQVFFDFGFHRGLVRGVPIFRSGRFSGIGFGSEADRDCILAISTEDYVYGTYFGAKDVGGPDHYRCGIGLFWYLTGTIFHKVQ